MTRRQNTEEQHMAGTLAEKVWDAHLVRRGADGSPDLLYICLLYTSPSPRD